MEIQYIIAFMVRPENSGMVLPASPGGEMPSDIYICNVDCRHYAQSCIPSVEVIMRWHTKLFVHIIRMGRGSIVS